VINSPPEVNFIIQRIIKGRSLAQIPYSTWAAFFKVSVLLLGEESAEMKLFGKLEFTEKINSIKR